MTVIDMHLHIESRSSCSILKVEELFDNLSPRIEGICITDHEILKPIKKLYIPERRILFGVELRSDLGDILAYGLENLPSKGLNPRQTIKFIHQQNGVAVCAHPFSNRHLAFGEKVYDYNFDAIEINGAIGKQANKRAKEAATIMNLPIIGGSDAHSKEQLNTIATKFQNEITSITEIVHAIKNGECEVIRV
ncbi:MAG: hypothetical protein BAJALOKI2v1_410025 [Promethearchaeota archaeon]|nr:MAG: hypothetical protein BAJALOKI2v1_410025 [Candidatus Lokiarchaeota archaeon]